MNYNQYFNKALEYEDYIDLLGKNKEIHELHYKKFEIDPTKMDIIKNMPAMHILVISEPWCSDSVALLPVVKKISECHKFWKLKIILRDKNPDLIDQFLTDGTRSIPIFLFLDQDGELLFKWGPRPYYARLLFENYRKKIESGEISKKRVLHKIRTFYDRDRGKESLKEILNQLQNFKKKINKK